MTLSEMREAKLRAKEVFFRISGVTGIGLGPKQVAGKSTREASIIVFVQRKRSSSDLSAGELIPKSFEGISTDVQSLSGAGQACGTASIGETPFPDELCRPLLGGVAIRNYHYETKFCDDGDEIINAPPSNFAEAGTLGCFARSIESDGHPGRICLLTNQHVVTPASDPKRLGADIYQPNPPLDSEIEGHSTALGARQKELEAQRKGSCPSSAAQDPSPIGRVYRVAKTGESPDDVTDFGRIDAALVALSPGLKYRPEILADSGTFQIAGVRKITSADENIAVKKRGTTSHVTTGTLVATSFDQNGGTPGATGCFVVPSTELLLVKPDDETSDFVYEGDSGSVLLDDDNRVLGLIFYKIFSGYALAIPIDRVTDALECEIIVGGGEQEVPSNNLDGVPHVDEFGVSVQSAAEAVQNSYRRVVESAAERIRSTSPLGAEYERMMRSQVEALYRLVYTNRKAAAIWHANSGPTFMWRALSVITDTTSRFPTDLYGKPWDDCVDNVVASWQKYGEPSLAEAAPEFASILKGIKGATFEELLSQLESRR